MSTAPKAEFKSVSVGAEVVYEPIPPLNFSGVRKEFSRCWYGITCCSLRFAV